jgi:hypothetical protein
MTNRQLISAGSGHGWERTVSQFCIALTDPGKLATTAGACHSRAQKVAGEIED